MCICNIDIIIGLKKQKKNLQQDLAIVIDGMARDTFAGKRLMWPRPKIDLNIFNFARTRPINNLFSRPGTMKHKLRKKKSMPSLAQLPEHMNYIF